MSVERDSLLNSGQKLMRSFCELNDVVLPNVNLYTRAQWRFSSTCAYYRAENIHIAPDRCAVIGRGGRAWSYPGYVIDRTPYGVVQHELGHHVDYLLSKSKGAYGGDFSVNLRARTGEEKITSYAPNDWEWFAEIFRLFVTNSDLLRRLRPNTWEELSNILKPAIAKPWKVVLKNAPVRTLEMAARKIENAR